MLKIKRTYEQFCTHMGRNVIIEETVFENGKKGDYLHRVCVRGLHRAMQK